MHVSMFIRGDGLSETNALLARTPPDHAFLKNLRGRLDDFATEVRPAFRLTDAFAERPS